MKTNKHLSLFVNGKMYGSISSIDTFTEVHFNISNPYLLILGPSSVSEVDLADAWYL